MLTDKQVVDYLPILYGFEGFSRKDLNTLTAPTIKALKECHLDSFLKFDPFNESKANLCLTKEELSYKEIGKLRHVLAALPKE